MAIPTNANQVQAFAGAMYGVQVGTVTMAQVNNDIQVAGGLDKALNKYYAASFGSATTASVAAMFAANLGLTGAALSEGTNYVNGRLAGVPANERGAVIADILNLFAGLASDATFGAAATAWNAKVTAAEGYAGTSNPAFGSNVGQGTNFALTVGIDSGAAFVGGSGNDTFAGSTSAGALTLSSLDAIDGGAGNDTLTIAAIVAVNTTNMVGATVKNIETVTITSTNDVTADTTAWTGTTSLTTASTGDTTLTAAATTDITATAAGLSTGVVINGGKSVVLSISDTATTAAASNNVNTVGVSTAAAGAVLVTQTESVTDGADAGVQTGSIRVDGGTTVNVNSLATVGAGNNALDVATIGNISVAGKGTVTSVTVTQSAATAVWAATGDKISIANGPVTIVDNNTATKADTITTVTLANFDDSTIQGNALTTLSLIGGASIASGNVGISQSAGLTTDAPTTLGISIVSGKVGIIEDAAGQYKSLNISSAAAATIAGLDFTNATALNVSGAGLTTISAQTDLGKVTAITSTGGGLALSGPLATGTSFTGGAGKDSVDVGATTKAIATAAGDDKVTISASALGTGGSVDAGEGVDTLSMTAANAVTASAGTSFETTITGFEKLALGNVATNSAVNLANLDDLNDVAIAGTNAATALTLSGASTGINLRFSDATQTSTIVTLANSGSADVANVFLTTADELSTHAAIDLTGFEALNIASADTDTNTVAASNVITTLTAGDATTVVVTGNAGLALAAGFTGTKVTSFDASGVTAGAVTYTTGALVSAATIKGGAGADTLSAANATKAVTINGGAGNDGITGSSTKGSTLNGDAGNDVITGGAAADVVDGGAGTDTFVANNAEQAGASLVKGAVVNLSDAALTQSAVFAATGKYLTAAAPSIAAGSATYLFDGESTTNDSVVDTLASIENVTGTATDDYIVGSTADNGINGGAGLDVMTGGSGADTFTFTTASTGLPSSTVYDTITDYAKGSDIISATALILGTQTAAAAAGVATITSGVATFNVADVSFAQHLAAVAAAQQATAGATTVWQEGADTYMFISDGTLAVGATDVLIKLVGVTAGALTVAANAVTAMA